MKFLKSTIRASAGAAIIVGTYCVYNDNETFYKKVIIPTFHKMDPELAHRLTILSLKYVFFGDGTKQDSSVLETKLHHLKFNNPIGMAAGFDKNGEAVKSLVKIGFGFVEVGSITPNPQPGNDKPRVFRLIEDEAIVNRYGFNSDGHEVVYERLKKLKGNTDVSTQYVLGINLGKNKNSVDAITDYCKGLIKFADVADYFVINISSPNTMGLRDLQKKGPLKSLLSSVIVTRNNLPVNPKPMIFLKLSPDLTTTEKEDIAEILTYSECKVDGLIISNTTTQRSPQLQSKHMNEIGGLSGRPLRDTSTEMISEMYILTKGSIPIIGVGGIFSGKDAYDKISAGASLVQLYTSFAFHGPPVVNEIKQELHRLIKANNFSSISEAVGSSVKFNSRVEEKITK